MQRQKIKNAVNNSSSSLTAHSRNEFIPIIESSNEEPLVDARILHEKLKIDTKFTMWIERRINEFDFKENEEFFPILGKTPKKGGRPLIEYHLTLDMAKELAMLERSDIGKKFRRYFIEAEKEFRLKRLYGQSTTLTEINKHKRIRMRYNDRYIYDYRKVQAMLGFSTKSSASNVKRNYGSQMVKIEGRNFVSEDYVKLMISRATSRHIAKEVKELPALVHADFGKPIFLLSK